MKKHLQFTLTLIVIAALLIGFWSARGQAAEKVWRIGFLSVTTRDSFHDMFFQGLKERGYVEGRNFVLESRVAAAKKSASRKSPLSWQNFRSMSSSRAALKRRSRQRKPARRFRSS